MIKVGNQNFATLSDSTVNDGNYYIVATPLASRFSTGTRDSNRDVARCCKQDCYNGLSRVPLLFSILQQSVCKLALNAVLWFGPIKLC